LMSLLRNDARNTAMRANARGGIIARNVE